MKLVKPFNQSFMYKVYEDGNRFFLTAVILTMFDFNDHSHIPSEIDLWKFVVSELGKETALDPCMPKPNGEALVAGKCYAPAGKPAQALEVRFRLGPISKRLYVFGDRYWVRAGGVSRDISEPEPFAEMRITYKRAFGGEGYDENPDGKGFAELMSEEGEKYHPLPNIEYADSLVASPKDRPRPASLGPTGMSWPRRLKRAGTYDEHWQNELFPGLARDMDFTFFNEAAEDQWIQGFFRGDEEFEIGGMHPEKPSVSSRLPGIKSRCFLSRIKDGAEVFQEIETRLDTVWLFPAAEKGIVVYRGVSEVADDEASDVSCSLVAYERMGAAPRTLDHYKAALAKRVGEDADPKVYLNESDLIAEGDASPFTVMIEEALASKKDSPLQRNMEKRAEAEMERSRETIKSFGLDPDEVLPKKQPQLEDLTLEDLKELDVVIEKARAEAMEEKEKALKSAKDACAQMGLDFDQLMEDAKRAGVKRPLVNAEEQIAQMRALGVNDPEIENKLRKAEEVAAEGYRKHGHHLPELALPNEDEKKASRELVKGRTSRGEGLAGLDLCGVDLAGESLASADLRGALMESSNLAGADLNGADLRGAVLVRANLEGANLAGANLEGANLGVAALKGARFNDARMASAVLAMSDASGADFSGADLSSADFMEARLSDAKLNKASIHDAVFLEADLAGADLSEADLTSAIFFKCNLAGADLSRATLKAAVLVESNADGAVFNEAKAMKLCAAKDSTLNRAGFKKADLKEAALVETSASGADFSGANLELASFLTCNLASAKFKGANALQARFDKSDLTDADLTGANLMEASLAKARLARADFSRANLYGAEVFRAKLGDTRFEETNLKKTKIEHWRPK